MRVVKGEDLLVEGDCLAWIVKHIMDTCDTVDKMWFKVMRGET